MRILTKILISTPKYSLILYTGVILENLEQAGFTKSGDPLPIYELTQVVNKSIIVQAEKQPL